MTTTYEVPLTPDPQTFNIILGITEYALTLYWNPADEGGWILDIADAKSGDALAAGIPLVTGTDLLSPYAYLGFAGQLFVATDGDQDAVPTFENLGDQSHLYFVTLD